MARLRLPQVIGEMVAGIMLGPSLLGLISPSALETLFPGPSVEYLQLFSQFGVIFFLFLIGLEFDPQLIRRSGPTGLVISASSIAAPFAIGILMTWWLYPRLFDDPQGTRFVPAAMFVGLSISVTAFAVLRGFCPSGTYTRRTLAQFA